MTGPVRWAALTAALVVVGASAVSERFTIAVTPHVLFEGNAVRIRCRVPRDPENRWLQVALEGYRSSVIPIEGERGPVTTEITYDHVPCDVELASCTVETARGIQRRITAHLEIICRS